jgi:hypothetical protein
LSEHHGLPGCNGCSLLLACILRLLPHIMLPSVSIESYSTNRRTIGCNGAAVVAVLAMVESFAAAR